jgi:hypothetical protein
MLGGAAVECCEDGAALGRAAEPASAQQFSGFV